MERVEASVLQERDKEKKVGTMKALFQKEVWMKRILGLALAVLIFSVSGFDSEAAEGKVIADTAKIRSEASTGSEVVGSTVKGKTVDIVGAVKDSSGTVWYKVPNGNNTYGYIRSDLIETSDEIKITEAASSTASNTESTSKPADTVPTAIGEQKATISVGSAKIRSGASTQHDSLASLPEGTVITLIGEANDSAGNKWYQMTCDYNGRSVQGYVRSDLITIGAAENTDGNTDGSTDGNAEGENPEGQTGENPEDGGNTEGAEGEQTQEPVEEHNDYEVVYNDETYWLYDNINGTMMSVTNLLQVVNQANENNAALQSQLKTEKIIIIVLAVIVVLLVIGVTILLFKLRDAYYYEEDYEEEEEEIEEEPVVPRKRKRRAEEEEEIYAEEPVRKKRPRESQTEEMERPARKKTSAERQEGERQIRQKPAKDAELQAAERKQPAKKPAQRKAQNFLVDDDEFEFEFLNMDDKDLK